MTTQIKNKNIPERHHYMPRWYLERFADTEAQKVADQSNIEHRYCDPTTLEREKHDIKKGDHRRRKEYWMDCMRNNREDSIIIICGSDHLDSFSALLLQAKFKVEILSDGWGKDISLCPF